ncbi:MAG: hypothetical protein Q9165_005442 [Trypethelium subeluteriae]
MLLAMHLSTDTTTASPATKLESKPEQIGAMLEDSMVSKLADQGRLMSKALAALDQKHTASIERLAREIQLTQLALVHKPSLQKAAFDKAHIDVEQSGMHHANAPHAELQSLRNSRRCHCWEIMRGSMFEFKLGRIAAFYASTFYHQMDCSFYRDFARTKTVGLRILATRALLHQTLEFSFAISVGAGGVSMSPSLTFSCLRRAGSPAFAALKGMLESSKFHVVLDDDGRSENVWDFEEVAEKFLEHLEQLFREHKALPYELDEHEQSLWTVFGSHYISRRIPVYGPYYRIHAQSFKKLAVGLARLQVPLDYERPSYHGDQWSNTHILDFAASAMIYPSRNLEPNVCGKPFLRPLYNDCIDCMAVMAKIGFDTSLRENARRIREGNARRLHSSFLQKLAYNIPGLGDDYECGELSKAVISSSRQRLTRMLANHPKSINERNALGQSPLHLCVHWPSGLQLLLSYGADVHQGDNNGCLPMCYAYEDDHLQAVQILADSGSAIFCHKCGSVERAFWRQSPELARVIATIIAGRRRELRSIAEYSLPSLTQQIRQLFNNELSDKFFFSILALLDEHEIPIPQVLRDLSYTKLHHRRITTVGIAQELYNAGFTELDVPDDHGFTPLALLCHHYVPGRFALIKLASWYVSKGADLYRNIGPLDTKVVHLVAYKLGMAEMLKHSSEEIPLMDDDCRKLLRTVSLSENGDSCLCSCSVGGCKPITMFLKPCLDWRRGALSFGKDVNPIDMLEVLILATSRRKWYDQQIFSQVIRYLTFEELEITHLCCLHSNFCCTRGSGLAREDRSRDCVECMMVNLSPMPEENASEIYDEEYILHERLESLVEEFCVKQQELQLPISEFLELYWEPRMEEMKAEDPLTAEELAKIKHLGIELVDEESQ